MTYIDASVALAHLFLEGRRPHHEFWESTLVSSRLLEYEIWTVLHARAFAQSHGDAAGALLARITLLELAPPVITRALGAFPVAVRTLDALHLASIDYLRQQRQAVELATYDRRMRAAAEAMEIPVVDLTN